MKCILVVISLVLSAVSIAQESLEPIGFQPRGEKKKKSLEKTTSSLDSTFVYSFDTLSLPVFDDFSTNLFTTKSAIPGAPNVTEEKYYNLLDNVTSAPLPNTVVYSSQITKRRTTTGGVTTDTDLTPIVVQQANFNFYPIQYSTLNAYPAYTIFDTLDFVNDPDTIFSSSPDLLQDSLLIFKAYEADPTKIWQDNFAYHNYTHAVNPWTLGVATFDGLDETGYPYNFGSTTTGIADFLTSKNIDLSAKLPSDSIYLSFLVQTGGFGDEPEAADSLILEFYNAQTDVWERTWSSPGAISGDFKVGHIRISQAKYLTSGFKFRFKNYGGLSGMLDEFHLDYINLRQGSIFSDTLFKDFAFVYPIGTLLDTYTQVPWDHWKNDPTHMNTQGKVVVRNGSNVQENNLDGVVDIQVSGVNEGNYTLLAQDLSGNNPNYAPRTVYESFHDFSQGYTFSSVSATNDKTFDIIGGVAVQYQNPHVNDTSYSKQYFGDVYAYDDGSAEKAYGITATQARLAVKFEAYEADTLKGVRMNFVPSVTDVSNKLWLLTVWADNNGQPGSVLYEDNFFFPRTPIYEDGRGVFTDYLLKDTTLSLPKAPFYVGWRQIDANRLNVGYDMNNPNNDKVFYSINAGQTWNNSSLNGVPLIRPIFSTANSYTLGVNEPIIETLQWGVYPNPTSGLLSVSWDNTKTFPGAELRDATGRLLQEISTEISQFNLTDMPAGIYFVSIKGIGGSAKKVLR